MEKEVRTATNIDVDIDNVLLKIPNRYTLSGSVDIITHILQLVAENQVNPETFEFIFAMSTSHDSALLFGNVTKIIVGSQDTPFPVLCNRALGYAQGVYVIFLSHTLRVKTGEVSFFQDTKWFLDILHSPSSTGIFGPKVLSNYSGTFL